jgi:ABC-type sugar transport system substrate-binding protein
VRRLLAFSLVLAAAMLSAAAPAVATRYVAGSPGSGDPFFPQAGNGGYDARHYWTWSTTPSPTGSPARPS